MSKQWFYQVMGSELGPVSPAELKEKVRLGQIQAETPVRLGKDGKWQAADRVKGLLDAPAAPVATAFAKPAEGPSAPAAGATAGDKLPPHTHQERTYHLVDDQNPHGAAPGDDEPAEYDFFSFVGFEQAIGAPLHQALMEHCRKNQLCVTQATRRALAEFLGRKDLLEGKSAPPSPAAETPPAAAAAP